MSILSALPVWRPAPEMTPRKCLHSGIADLGTLDRKLRAKLTATGVFAVFAAAAAAASGAFVSFAAFLDFAVARSFSISLFGSVCRFS